jgi:hypothetical protein
MSSPDANQPTLDDTIKKSQLLFNELKKYSDNVIAEMDSMLEHVNHLRVLSDLLEKTVLDSKLKIYSLTGDIGKYDETKKEIDTHKKTTPSSVTRTITPVTSQINQKPVPTTSSNPVVDNIAIKGRLLSAMNKR